MIPGIIAGGGGGAYVPPFAAFMIQRTTGSAQSISTGNNTLVFDFEWKDVGGLVNLGVSTSQAIIPPGRAGVWRFGMSGQLGGTGNVTFQIFVNGAATATLVGPIAAASNIARCVAADVTVAAGDVITAVVVLSSGSTTVSRQTDAPNFWGYKKPPSPGVSASVSRTGTYSLASNTAGIFNNEISDTGGFYSAGQPSRLTIPATGYYHITAEWTYSGTAGSITTTVNGVTDNGSNPDARVFTNGSASRTDALDILHYLNSGDYVQFITHQSISIASGSYQATIERVDY